MARPVRTEVIERALAAMRALDGGHGTDTRPLRSALPSPGMTMVVFTTEDGVFLRECGIKAG